MKRIAFLMTALVICMSSMMAIPANKTAVKVQQPDGSYVTIRLHGDEWMSFCTTEDGYSVVQDSRGYYVYAELRDGQLEATDFVAHDLTARTASEWAFLADVKKYQAPAVIPQVAEIRNMIQQRQEQQLRSRRTTSYENFKGLLILVEYNDKSFSRNDYKELLADMVNKEGYTGYDNEKYTGSVRDYFSDCSFGKFKPVFDLYGPYKVDYSQTDPRGSSSLTALYSRKIVNAALDAADADINYSDYDCDGDGVVDLVFFMLPGCGSNFSGNNSRYWWPHRGIIATDSGETLEKDGVAFQDYASSVEMYGWERILLGGHTIDGIGTICHEFSHVLGLPDFYDSDYSSSGGQSNDPGKWSLMADGSSGDRGRTPVPYSLYERWAVGFIDEPEIINTEGHYTLDALYKEGKGYMIETPVANEFFLLENRQKDGYKWNEYLPGSGMLVHRVDKTDLTVWTKNKVNCTPSHNYYEIVRAGGTSPSSRMNTEYDVFPGTGHVATLNNETKPANLKTWSGEDCPWGLKNIKLSNKVISFDVVSTDGSTSITVAGTEKRLSERILYNLQGQRVDRNYKGLVVHDGKKYNQK